MKTSCARCKAEITKDTAEYCWYCGNPCLCGPCWDEHGECGHKGAHMASDVFPVVFIGTLSIVSAIEKAHEITGD